MTQEREFIGMVTFDNGEYMYLGPHDDLKGMKEEAWELIDDQLAYGNRAEISTRHGHWMFLDIEDIYIFDFDQETHMPDSDADPYFSWHRERRKR